MESITISSKEELTNAMKSGFDEIIVEGNLAEKLHKTKKVAMLSGVALTAILALGGGAVALTPVSGGLSMLALAPVAALSGLEIATIITAVAIGVSLIIAVAKDYEEISYDGSQLTLRKKKQSTK